MIFHNMQTRSWMAAGGLFLALTGTVRWTAADELATRDELTEPVYRVTKHQPDEQPLEGADKHPLDPVLQLATELHSHVLTNVKDYTCTLVKRENIGGEVLPHEFMLCKIRNEQVENGQVVDAIARSRNHRYDGVSSSPADRAPGFTPPRTP